MSRNSIFACLLQLGLSILLLVSAPAFGQSWSVSYFETRPDALESGRAEAGRYVTAIREADGNAAAVALQQRGRANQFVVIEAWESEGAREVHASGDAANRFRDGLQPILISGYDERLYLGELPGGDLRQGPEAVYVVTHIDIGSRPRETGINLVSQMVDSTGGDAGLVQIMVMPWATRDNHMTVLEIWENEEAHHNHLAENHMKDFRVALTPLIGSMYDERVYSEIE